MTNDEKYLFDLMGYIVIEDALTPEEVARCNAAIDHHIDQMTDQRTLSGGSKALEGTSTRKDLGGMLSWEHPWCDPFPRVAGAFECCAFLQWDFGSGLSA